MARSLNSDEVVLDLSIPSESVEANGPTESTSHGNNIALLPTYTALPTTTTHHEVVKAPGNDVHGHDGWTHHYSAQASLNQFTASGFYSAIWNVSLPTLCRITDGSQTSVIFDSCKTGGRIEVSGVWHQNEADKQQQQQQPQPSQTSASLSSSSVNNSTQQTIQLLLNHKLWIQQGDQLDNELQLVFSGPIPDLQTPPSFSVALNPYNPNQIDSFSTSSTFFVIPVENHTIIPPSLIPPCIQQNPKEATYEASTLSGDQKSLVTLSRQGFQLFLDIWDLSHLDNPNGFFKKDPIVSTIFNMDPKLIKDPKSIRGLLVTISEKGDYVAIYQCPIMLTKWSVQEGYTTGHFGVQVFERIFNHKGEKSGLEERSVTKSSQELRLLGFNPTTELLLPTFVGHVGFQNRYPGNLNKNNNNSSTSEPEKVVLVTGNGLGLDIYNLERKSTPTAAIGFSHTVSLTPILTPKDSTFGCQTAISSLRDSLFVWDKDDGEPLSVWNWRTARCIGYIPRGDRFYLSKDEKSLVVIGLNFTSTYSITVNNDDGNDDGIALTSWNSRVEPEDRFVTVCLPVVKNTDGGDQHLVVIHWKLNAPTAYRYINTANAEDELCFELSVPQRKKTLGFLSVSLTKGSIGTILTCDKGIFEFSNAVATAGNNNNTNNKSDSSVQNACGPDCKDRWHNDDKNDQVYHDQKQQCIYKFERQGSERMTRLYRLGNNTTTAAADQNTEAMLVLEIPDRPYDQRNCRILLSNNNKDIPRFLVWSRFELQIWQLPIQKGTHCKLLGLTIMTNNDFVCRHGNIQKYTSAKVFKSSYDTSANNLLKPKDTDAVTQALDPFLEEWDSYPLTYQNAIIELVIRHINQSHQRDDQETSRSSIMWTILQLSAFLNKDHFLKTILEFNHPFQFWIPHKTEFSTDAEQDVIAFLVSRYKFSMAQLLIEYCLTRAHETHPMFLHRLMISVPHLMEKHPETVLEISRRAAFIPVKHRQVLVNQAVFNSPFGLIKRNHPSDLYDILDDNPVFSLCDSLPIFTTLKIRQDAKKKIPTNLVEIHEKNTEIKANLFVVPVSLLLTTGSKAKNNAVVVGDAKSLVQVVEDVFRLVSGPFFPLDLARVHLTFSDLDTFDNPAISALMNYGWKRFARYMWAIRFFYQAAYEILVLGITFVQLYGDLDQRTNLHGGYIAIIVLGLMLLYLEVQQMRDGIREYFFSPYNYVDIGSYAIPVIASCVLLTSPDNAESLRALSFSVVIIYLHFIFELRIFNNVCKVVTIVVNILLAIPAFFIILAIFIIAFAHSINHLTEVNYRSFNCQPNEDGSVPTCQTLRDEFPKAYMQSVSATYYFMTGDYGPVGTALTDGHWTSQLMVAVFFFLTAVLMMNVVIALMNGVYSDAVVASEKIWLKNRLDSIASAENFGSFAFPTRFKTFPKYIYYSCTDKQVEDYYKRYELDKSIQMFNFGTNSNNSNNNNNNNSSSSVTDGDSILVKTLGLVSGLESKLSAMELQFEREKKESEKKLETMQQMLELLLTRVPDGSPSVSSSSR